MISPDASAARRAMRAVSSAAPDAERPAPREPAPAQRRYPRSPATRDPGAWAIYVRAGDHDGRALLASVQMLGLMVGRRGGHVAGIYGDMGTPDGPELAVLLGHASFNQFANLAIVDVDALGANLDRVALTVTCLFDLGVRLYAYRHAGEQAAQGFPLDLDDVGRDVLGAIAHGEYGRTIDVISNTVGTAPGNRRPRP